LSAPSDAVSASRRRDAGNSAGVLTLKFSIVGLILSVDQMLLPMFHIFRSPYKISYLLLGLWALYRVAYPQPGLDRGTQRDFLRFSALIAGIVICALLGEAWLALNHPVLTYTETLRSVQLYVLIVLAFGLGQSARAFKLNWLVWLVYAYIFLSLLFIYGRQYLPTALIDFYYPPWAFESRRFGDYGFLTNISFVNLDRPRGLFGNPNNSALQMNVISLFIYLALRNGLLRISSTCVAAGIVVLPLVITVSLGSIGEAVSSAVLAIGHVHLLFWQNSGPLKRFAIVAVLALSTGGFIGWFVQVQDVDANTFTYNLNRIISVADTYNKLVEAGAVSGSKARGFARPLLTFDVAYERFKFSPVFGSGFSASASGAEPFGDTRYFHNDWFYVAVTSGIIGLICMLWIVIKYCLPLGIVALLPFVISGTTNTLLLSIPTVIFYFFMVGVLREKLRRVAAGGSPG